LPAGDHTFDFYKPAGGSPYPEFDGPCSISTYMAALDSCAQQLRRRLQQVYQSAAAGTASSSGASSRGAEPAGTGALHVEPGELEQCRVPIQEQQQQQQEPNPALLLSRVDHFVAHAPFHRMVRKALAHLLLTDALLGSRWVQLVGWFCLFVGAGWACWVPECF
jgi:3-hydroxy-3-methylglutaryl CoA synthase